MSRTQRELALCRRLLAIAVYRLGGEMRVTQEDLQEHWQMGMDHYAHPTVVTGYRLSTPENLKK
jgi:hypothetical protein